MTLQKYFDKSFYFLLSGTLFNSQYTGSDGVTRNTSYNGTYIANLLAGKEFKLNDKQTISLGIKTTVAGGQWYGNVDVAATNQLQELVYLDEGFNSRRFTDYFRFDTKINWKTLCAEKKPPGSMIRPTQYSILGSVSPPKSKTVI